MSTLAIEHELEDLVLHLKGVVHVRALLEDRGAPAAEIEAHSAEIERLRARLAQLARQSGGQNGASA